jgi:hypothetical protein
VIYFAYFNLFLVTVLFIAPCFVFKVYLPDGNVYRYEIYTVFGKMRYDFLADCWWTRKNKWFHCADCTSDKSDGILERISVVSPWYLAAYVWLCALAMIVNLILDTNK